MTQKEIWYETLHTGFGQYFSVEKVLYREKTDHQDLVIFENPVLGRVMALDGVVQTTERDEFIYHEMLTHVPLLAHGQAKKVLIIGGGDGGMLREVSRHPGVEQITMVEEGDDPRLGVRHSGRPSARYGSAGDQPREPGDGLPQSDSQTEAG